MKIEKWIDAFQPADGPPPETLSRFMRWCLSGSWPALWLATFLSALAGAMEAVTAYVMGAIIDSTNTTTPAAFFSGENAVLLLGGVAFFLIARPVFFGLSSAANSIIVGPNLNPLVLSRLHRWTLGQSVSFFDDDFAGRLAQKQMQTARAVTDVLTEVINVVAFALASLFGTIFILVAIDLRIALLFGVWLIFYFALIRWFLPRVRSRAAERAGSRAMVSGQVVDTITNIKTVKLFAHADHEDKAALGALGNFRDRSIEFGYLAAGFRFCLMTLAGALPVLLIGASLWLWQRGLATTGEIVAAGTVSIRISQMTGWVSFTLMQIYSNLGEVEDGMKTLTPNVRVDDAPNAKPLQVPQGEIVLDKLCFAYGRDFGGIHEISLTIKPGEKVGIVGASGAGKTTLVSLLLGLYGAEQGDIRIDGQSMADVTQDSLRQQISMVTQDTAMFNRSARDNIMYGRPDATEADMIAAAEQAEAHVFIQDLKDHRDRVGYEAHLGERGVKLSGGQRQRIALARAILKDAPILVLDEATSALDSEVEALIQAALTRVMEGKTVLAIAHRLSTLSEMDRIIVMDSGQIAEQGNHEDLLKKDGLYAQYWQRQSGGFIRADVAE
ncbi:MAG: ABC transporter ATP-binding protein [Aliishimia sp.]